MRFIYFLKKTTDFFFHGRTIKLKQVILIVVTFKKIKHIFYYPFKVAAVISNLKFLFLDIIILNQMQ